MPAAYLLERLPPEGALARCQLKQNQAQASTHPRQCQTALASRLFRGHVKRRSRQCCGGRVGDLPRQAKIQNLGKAVLAPNDVVRFQISVNDSFSMGGR